MHEAGSTLTGRYCTCCGYHLGDDGIARQTVVAPEKPIELWFATANENMETLWGADWCGDEYACHVVLFEPEIDCGHWYDQIGCTALVEHEKATTDYYNNPEAKGYPPLGEKRRYLLIPAPQEGEDE